MTMLFFIPLSIIAVYEAHIAPSKRFKDLFPENNPEVEGDDNIENPSSPDQEDGNQISKISFKELCSVFPDTTQGSQAAIVAEIVRSVLCFPFTHKLILSFSWPHPRHRPS